MQCRVLSPPFRECSRNWRAFYCPFFYQDKLFGTRGQAAGQGVKPDNRRFSIASRGQADNRIHSVCDGQGRIIMVQFSVVDPYVTIINEYERSSSHPGEPSRHVPSRHLSTEHIPLLRASVHRPAGVGRSPSLPCSDFPRRFRSGIHRAGR